jgi:benzoate-CoA ligase
VAVNTLLPAQDYAYMMGHCRARLIITNLALLPVVLQALDQQAHTVSAIVVAGADETELKAFTSPIGLIAFKPWIAAQPLYPGAVTAAHDPAFWLYSSGSTGRPKGTVHTQANLFYTAQLYGKAVLNIRPTDIVFSAAKLFFAYGLGNALSFPLSVGATTVLMAERPTPEAVFKRWVDHQTTVFYGAPTGYAGMLASPSLPSKSQVSLRLASSAGEALPADIGQRFTDHFGVEVIDGIGSTEMLHIFLSNQPGRVRYGTTGWPVPGYEIELRGENASTVPDGEPGDLYIKGPSAALMYWGNRIKSQDTFLGPWTKSGDKYIRNADGSYTYAGRSDDMLKVSGIYVSPFEVEATLVQHEAVLEAAVIGVADQDGLTRTKAFVVLKAGRQATDQDLKAFVKDRLAPYKYPRQIEFVAELPKTATGKIQRFRLREQEKSKT